MNVGQTNRVGAVAPSTETAPAKRAGDPPPVLPPPSLEALAGLDDAVAIMMLLEIQSRDANKSALEAHVGVGKEIREKISADLEKKYKEWLDAQNSPFNFLNDLLKGVALALSGVLTACTGGALSGLMAGALVLSCASLLVEKTQMFGKDSAGVAMGLNIGAMVCGLTGSIGSLAASAGAKLGEFILGKTALAQDVLGKSTEMLRATASMASASNSLQAGASQIGAAHHTKQQEDLRADMEGKRAIEKAAQRYLEMILQGVTTLQESHRNSVESLAKAQTTLGDTLVLSGRMG